MDAQSHEESIENEMAFKWCADGAAVHEARSRSIFDELFALNRSYLSLLVESAGYESWTVPTTLACQLSQLSAAGLATVACCPFSLFPIALDEVVPRVTAVDFEDRSRDTLYDRRAAFAHSAVFYAWHLVTQSESSTLLARLLLGLPPHVAVLLRTTSLAQLTILAFDVSADLRPRWSHHPYFWNDLILAATNRTEREIAAVRLLGRQLMAAEVLKPPTVKSRYK